MYITHQCPPSIPLEKLAWTKKPNKVNMGSLPFLIYFTFNSANASGLRASPNGSKLPPGYSGSGISPNGPPAILYPQLHGTTHQDNLVGPDGEDALGIDKVWVAQVVKAPLAEVLGFGLELHGLSDFDIVPSQKLREYTAQGAEQSPAF